MSKPIINKISSFDATKDYTITMSYIGKMPYNNKVYIYDVNNLEEPVYTNDTNTNISSLSRVIPANTLSNGHKYCVQALVYEDLTTTSSLSDRVYFYCFSTPQFYFDDIFDGDVIKSASFYAKLIYKMPNDEKDEDITSFQFLLYDSGKNLLNNSEVFHNTQYLTYSYRGLIDDAVYYIRATGESRHGIQMDTGYIQILVKYNNNENYDLVFADCDETTGVVTYRTRFIVINPTTPSSSYSYDNSVIDLTGNSLTYNKNFEIKDNFTMTIRALNMNREGIVMTANNGTYTMSLSVFKYDGYQRFKLSVPNGLSDYILYSNELKISESQMVTIHIRRVNNVYSLTVSANDYDPTANYWFRDSDPSNQIDVSEFDVWIDEEGVRPRITKDDIKILYQDDEPVGQYVDFGVIWIGGKDK